MGIVCIVIQVVCLLLMVCTRRQQIPNSMHTNRILRMFDRVGVWLVSSQMRRWRSFRYIQTITRRQECLYPFMRAGEAVRIYLIRKVAVIVALVLAGASLGVVWWLFPQTDLFLQKGTTVERLPYGEGDVRRQLLVQIGNTKRPYWIEVQQQSYSYDDVERLFEERKVQLEREVLADNDSADHVTKNLNFVDSLPGTALALEWSMDRTDLVDYEGRLQTESLTEEGDLLSVTAVLPYEKREFRHTFTVRVCLEALSEQDRLYRKLQKEIMRIDENTRTNDVIVLPSDVEGEKVTYQEIRQNNRPFWLLLTFAAAAGVFFGQDRDLKKSVDRRNRQMLLDYPDLVSRVSLLLRAGMSVRGAFFKIAGEYMNQRNEYCSETRYAYDELLVACRNMQSGMPEAEAYAQFGRRCGLSVYLRFSALLTQNLRKGNSRLLSRLSLEAAEAMEQHRAAVIAIGAEAGTKVLLPMVLLLIVVLIVLLAPAFLSVNI